MSISKVEFNFINISRPDDAKASSHRLTVRSQASQAQWQKVSSKRVTQHQKRLKNKRNHQPMTFVFELEHTVSSEPNDACSEPQVETPQAQAPSDLCAITRILGGGRVDPFRSYPVAWRPYLPGVVDHYLSSLAVDIPELDQPGNKGLLRSRWFPLIMTEPASFLVIVLTAASHYASVNNTRSFAVDLLNLKHETLSAVNQGMRDQNRMLSDQLIGAVAKMASYEAMFGDQETYEIHMAGVKRMVKLRGGLACLGLGGLLEMALQGQVALVTGGAKNLGAEIALELAPLGANLALHYNSASTKEDATKLESTLKEKYPNTKVAFYQGDLTTGAAVEKLFKDVVQDFGKVDIVVNTIGKVLKKPITEVSEQEYDDMFAINSKAAFLILKAGAAHVSEGGKLITIVTALLAAFTGFYTPYAGSKAPVEHFTRGVSKELQSKRVSVNAVAPGPMDTPFFYPQESPEAVEFHKSMGMGGRLTNVKDIAPIIKFLCTEGQWITGQTIFANGGYTTR
ncbi:hypothetical protein FQN54_009111 [Arachnomyces sp. PD_36]|nr:hypothetical protein FQN54_009111 [Arachnomyces sp. PD_36]